MRRIYTCGHEVFFKKISCSAADTFTWFRRYERFGCGRRRTTSLFTNEEEVKHRKIEEAMMQINKAKGKTALVRARLIKDNDPTKV
nr:hypothetical protein [Treponema phagedenis]